MYMLSYISDFEESCGVCQEPKRWESVRIWWWLVHVYLDLLSPVSLCMLPRLAVLIKEWLVLYYMGQTKKKSKAERVVQPNLISICFDKLYQTRENPRKKQHQRQGVNVTQMERQENPSMNKNNNNKKDTEDNTSKLRAAAQSCIITCQ